MNRNCENCYWKGFRDKWCVYSQEQPEECTCNYHDFTCFECESENSSYKYKGKYYCNDCLLKQFNVYEEEVTNYYSEDGEFLGSSNNMDEVIKSLSDEIEEIE